MASSGVALPLSRDALEALRNMTSGGFVNLVQLAINVEKETIELANASSSAIRDFTKVIADDSPRFSFFVFKHIYDGVEEAPLAFIYTCPPDSTIKEKMLYASCRAGVVATAENECGLKINKKLEAASPHELGEV
ncbi:C-Teminal domain of Twinfilin-1 [Wilcoxina mikolae CBS 423.85]|nr:C-Teminal domain of Twinfilin-1 [Wilcoxina mikolae CBS 423.85]